VAGFSSEEIKAAAVQVRWGDNPACPRCDAPIKKEVLMAGGICNRCHNRASVFHGTLFKNARKPLWPLFVITTFQKGYHPHLRYLMKTFKKKRKPMIAQTFDIPYNTVDRWCSKFPKPGGYFNRTHLLTIALAMDTIEVLKGRTHQGRFKKCLESGRDSMVASKPGEDSHPRIFSGQ